MDENFEEHFLANHNVIVSFYSHGVYLQNNLNLYEDKSHRVTQKIGFNYLVFLFAFIFTWPSLAMPVISEVCWMGSESSASDEWIEISNFSGEDISDLSSYVLIDGENELSLPNIQLTNRSIVVIEKRESSITNQDNPIISFTLSNGGERLMLCPLGWTDSIECDVVNPDGGDWYAGQSTPRQTMQRVNLSVAGNEPSNWVNSQQNSAVALDSLSTPSPGNPGEYYEIDLDSGTIDLDSGFVDAGNEPVLDSGSSDSGFENDAGFVNETPQIDYLALSDFQDESVKIEYQFSDLNSADSLEFALYYSQDNSSFDGVEISSSISREQEFLIWNTTNLPSGTFYVFAVVKDQKGAISKKYALESYTKKTETSKPSINIIVEHSEYSIGDSIQIFLDATANEASLKVSLYIDLDAENEDGELIAEDLEFENGQLVYNFNTIDMKTGSYYFYVVMEVEDAEILVQYSAKIDITEQNCTCSGTSGKNKDRGKIVFLSLILVFSTRRLIRKRYKKGIN